MKDSIKREQSQTGLNSAERENFWPKVKKFIEILNADAALKLLKAGKKLQGVLYIDESTGVLTYKPNNPHSKITKTDSLMGYTDYGRVTENSKFVKVYELYPKMMGVKRMSKAIDREADDVKDIIASREIIDRV